MHGRSEEIPPCRMDRRRLSPIERFLNSDVDFKIGNDHFQLIPFGAGRRGCPGALFAMTILLSLCLRIYMVHKFDWALPDGIRGEDLDMKECVGFN